MVGYTVNTGTSKDFAEGWDRVFGGGRVAKKKPAKKKAAAKAKKTPAKAKRK